MDIDKRQCRFKEIATFTGAENGVLLNGNYFHELLLQNRFVKNHIKIIVPFSIVLNALFELTLYIFHEYLDARLENLGNTFILCFSVYDYTSTSDSNLRLYNQLINR